MNTMLDVTRLPRTVVVSDGLFEVDLGDMVYGLRNPIEEMMSRRRTFLRGTSIGFAFGKCRRSVGQLRSANWDEPNEFIWFVTGWGSSAENRIADAVRMLRPTLREYQDTLRMRIGSPNLFRDMVPHTDDDGSYPWGDYPLGGGTLIRFGELIIPVAVSGLSEVENDVVAKLAGGLIGAELLKQAHPVFGSIS